ncbi:ABC-F family ATP-binding cassette domain-containing protein [Psychrobacillus sp. FSL W7-1457]|uniref:ribosomal protection-like ABC-F family protein n=1 Tax=Psychrobacillus sp. FSL W7-1457 TaxID=2954547 RepID=UPI00315A470F
MICKIQEISKMLGGNLIFDDLSLDIKVGDKLGIVGRNGSGKTTLFKLIAGIEKPDHGIITFKKGAKIGYLAQIPTFSESVKGKDLLYDAFEDTMLLQKKMSILENELAVVNAEAMEILLKQYGDIQEKFTLQGGYTIDSEIDKVVEGLELGDFVEQPFSSLSGGEQTKIMLGQLLLTKPDLLLLDEPTNHLDLFAIEWLEEYLVSYTGTVVIISHDRYFLDKVVTKVADLEDGMLTKYHGNYSSFLIEKEEKLTREFQQYEEQQKKIKKMREAIKRLRIWANQAVPPNASLHRQARNMERALERMEKVRKPLIDPKKMSLSFDAAPRSGKEVVIMEEAFKSFGEKMLLNSAELHVHWKDRLAIVGRNGTGKTTILNILRGVELIDSGEARFGSNVRQGYLSQHFEITDPKARLIDIFRAEVNVAEGEARHILAKFMFYGADVFKRIADLSGGERMRLRLAQLMHQDINCLILDEPTNHLDIDSREVLEEALDDFTGTIIAVSHDRYFLNKLFPRTAWLEHGVLTTFEGPYEWAREKWNEFCSKENIRKEIIDQPLKETTPAKQQKEIPLEKRISELENVIGELTKQISIENDWENYEALSLEKLRVEEQLEQLLEKWLDLAE